jgi:hypothetical protein
MPESGSNDRRASSRDHSTLRARLVGRELENRSIEAELRDVILQREARDAQGPSPTEADIPSGSRRKRSRAFWQRGANPT